MVSHAHFWTFKNLRTTTKTKMASEENSFALAGCVGIRRSRFVKHKIVGGHMWGWGIVSDGWWAVWVVAVFLWFYLPTWYYLRILNEIIPSLAFDSDVVGSCFLSKASQAKFETSRNTLEIVFRRCRPTGQTSNQSCLLFCVWSDAQAKLTNCEF